MSTPHPRETALVNSPKVLRSLPAWLAGEQSSRPPHVTHWVIEPTAMGTMPWPVMELPHVGALARLLDVDAGELAWFADTRGLERRADTPLRHYRWTVLPKRSGVRLVAAPKPRLKEIQRRLLRHVLARCRCTCWHMVACRDDPCGRRSCRTRARML